MAGYEGYVSWLKGLKDAELHTELEKNMTNFRAAYSDRAAKAWMKMADLVRAEMRRRDTRKETMLGGL